MLADSPIAYWQEQECRGNMVDSSGSGLTMTYNAGLVTYRTSTPLSQAGTYSIEMAGGNLWGTASVATTAVNNVTMEIWIKLVNPYVTINNNVFFYNGQSGANGYGMMVNTNDKLQLLVGGVAFGGSSSVPLTRDAWNHVVLVRDAGTWKWYINGAFDSNAGAFVPNLPAVSTFIGGGGVQRQTAHMAIYNTALSAAQIAAHYAAR